MQREYKDKAEYEAAVERIGHMEKAFGKACAAQKRLRNALSAYSKAAEAFSELSAYYEGEWKRDFAADENGELPSELKRGVLSEDGLWDIFEENKELAEQLKKLAEEIERA